MSGPAYYTATMNIAKNEDWQVPFLYAMQNEDGSTTPIDLTGSLFEMEIRAQDSDAEVFVKLTSAPGDGSIVITNAPGGAFQILIDRDATSQMPPGNYVADLVRVMPSGLVERIVDCAVTVVEGVTR